MSRILIALGVLLMCWGAVVLVRGDFVATLDIGASLVSFGVVVVALSAVVGALNRIADRLADRSEMSVPQQPSVQPQPTSQARPAVEPVAPAQTPTRTPAPVPEPEIPTAPVVVREGDIEGRRYRFFSDGSIEAEGPNGLRRYRSLDEAREQILRQRGENVEKPATPPEPTGRPDATARPEAAPRVQPEPRPAPVSPRAPSPPRGSRTDESPVPAKGEAQPAAPAREAVSWETYLASGRAAAESKPEKPAAAPPPSSAPVAKPATSDDDEWAEPFRMLLKGSVPETPEAKKPDDKRR